MDNFPLTYFLFIPFMVIVARACGGGWPAPYLNKRGKVDDMGRRLPGVIPFISLTMLPEIIFGGCFGVAFYWLHPDGLQAFGFHLPAGCAAFIAAAWSYFMMEQGHGNAFHDGTGQFTFPDRRQGLDLFVRPMCRALTWLTRGRVDFSPRSTWYCRTFMSFKGLLIGLPLGWWALLLAPLWAFAYYIGFRLLKSDSEPAELCSGGFAAITILCALGAG